MARGRRNPKPRRGSSNSPATSKPLQGSQLDIANWEEEKLKHGLNIQAIPYEERLSPLLPQYIPTLSALKDIASTSAFIAFDTESVPHCYKTTDVGLAFLPEINYTCSNRKETPNLREFALDHRVKAASFKVNGRYHDITRKLQSSAHPISGRIHRPIEPCRFCEESFVDIEDLETELINQIEQFRQEVPEKQLVLVGLSLQSDFERLSLEFPRVIELFSRWINLSTLMKAESPTPTKLHTGLGTALKIFRYPFIDTGFGDCRHQAANDAVRTLAALSGLTDPENVASLVLRQHQFVGIEVNSTTKHFESKLYRALLHVDGRDLPPLIDSAQKLAFAVQGFKPIGVAADCSNAMNKRKMHYRSSIHTPGRTCGCVCFKNNRELQDFISATNGWKYGEMVLKVVRAPLPERIRAQIEKGKNLKMKRKTSHFERVRALDINWANSFHDIFSIEDEHKEDITVLEDNSTTITLDYKGEDVGEQQQPSWFSRIMRKIIYVY